jgi:hypothetical protein
MNTDGDETKYPCLSVFIRGFHAVFPDGLWLAPGGSASRPCLGKGWSQRGRPLLKREASPFSIAVSFS